MGGPHDILAQRVAADAERLQLVEIGALVGNRPQHFRGAREPFLARLVLASSGGHAGSSHTRGSGGSETLALTQRSPAQTAADEHVHVLAQAQVVEARRRTRDALAVAAHLELLLRLDHAVGEVADGELLPTLQHGDLLAGPAPCARPQRPPP